MSAPTNIIIVLAAVTAGYFIEPIITQRGTKAETSNIQLDLSKVTHEDFPETVELVEDFNISDPSNEINILLPKGSSVKPVKISGEKLVIQHLSIPIESTININKTNFKKLVLPKILARSAQKPATTPGAVVKAESIPETTRETAAGTEPGTVVKTKPIPEPKAVEPVAKTEEIAQVKEEIKPAPVSPPKPEAIEICNQFAPEHLSLVVEDEDKYLSQVRTAGAIYVGSLAAVAVGDFVAGPSHTLPLSLIHI